MGDSICTIWLARHLHPDVLKGPHGGSTNRRLFRQQCTCPAYRCRACDSSYTRLTGTTVDKTRHRAAMLVLLRRNIT